MTKRILVLDGHPASTSLSKTLAETYAETAKDEGNDLRMWHLSAMDFDPNHDAGGYADNKPLEPVLQSFLVDLEWSEHFVLCTPMWWGSLPAKLKGLIDRAFIPGRTFSTRETTAIGLPKPMLTGRTARVILTADTPGYFLRIAYGNAIINQLRGQILGFVGFKPVRFMLCAPAADATPKQVQAWTAKVRRCAAAAI